MSWPETAHPVGLELVAVQAESAPEGVGQPVLTGQSLPECDMCVQSNHRLNMELDVQSLCGDLPAFGLIYEGAFFIGVNMELNFQSFMSEIFPHLGSYTRVLFIG